MAHTNLTYHLVFSTKYRKDLITPQLEPELYKYIGGIIKNKGGVQLEIGGISNHVHILAVIPPVIAVADMLRFIKSNSSKWVNQQPWYKKKFRWQIKYGAFTVSESQIPSVRRYIQDQKEHHRKLIYTDEYIQLLEKHSIIYDVKYLWD
ncbi:MAG: IS200/IS605 family transposase [Bacteroidota bacterium]